MGDKITFAKHWASVPRCFLDSTGSKTPQKHLSWNSCLTFLKKQRNYKVIKQQIQKQYKVATSYQSCNYSRELTTKDSREVQSLEGLKNTQTT